MIISTGRKDAPIDRFKAQYYQRTVDPTECTVTYTDTGIYMYMYLTYWAYLHVTC